MDMGRSETKIRDGDQPNTDARGVGVHGRSARTSTPRASWWISPTSSRTARSGRSPLAGKVVQHKKRWAKPTGPEWIVVGRDQIKRQSKTSGLGQPRRCFDRAVREWQPSKTVITDRKPITDRFGDQVVVNGIVQTKVVTEKRMQCPRCGAIPMKKGVPLGPDALKKSTHCQAMIMEEIGSPDGKCNGRDRLAGSEIPYEHRNAKDGSIVSHAGKKWRVRICNEPLYQFTHKPNWWPPALLMQRKMRRLASYLVVDEVHEQKAEDSEQSLAMGKILGTTEYCLALTGTFIGGYASHLFPLLVRMAARDMNARNFKWGSMAEFIERYGCNDRIEVTETVVDGGKKQGASIQHGEAVQHEDGVQVPAGRHAHAVLRDRHAAGHVPQAGPVHRRPAQLRAADDRLRAAGRDPGGIQRPANRAGRRQPGADRRRHPEAHGHDALDAAVLSRLPMGMGLHVPVRREGDDAQVLGERAADLQRRAPEHAVGWWQVPKVWTRNNYFGVVTPKNFDPKSIILPKERELINICKQNQDDGDQTWVYCEMTGKRDVMGRLASLMEAEGLRVGVLRSGDVSPRERDVWIQRHGYLYDVMLSHPQLVATGLDLFNLHHGNYNFNHLVFYQCGYNLFRLRQAERRSWRIGQPKDCTVTYLYYKGTSQATALALMGRKAQAAQQLEEGTVSDEGLAAMGGRCRCPGGSRQGLGDFIDPAEIQRNWGRVSGKGGAKRERKARPVRRSAISPARARRAVRRRAHPAAGRAISAQQPAHQGADRRRDHGQGEGGEVRGRSTGRLP